MTRNDLVAGARQWWALDRAETVAFALYMTVIAGVSVIAGAAIWLPVVFVLAGIIVPAIGGTVRRAREARTAREFNDWLGAIYVVD